MSRAIDVDGYIATGDTDLVVLRQAALLEHSGRTLVILTRAQAETLLRELREQLDALALEHDLKSEPVEDDSSCSFHLNGGRGPCNACED